MGTTYETRDTVEMQVDSSVDSCRTGISQKGCKADKVPTYDDKGILNFLLLRWVVYWVNRLKSTYFELSMLPPLPKPDQISYWQPVFSKHISDGLLMLEEAKAQAVLPIGESKPKKEHHHILMRAILLTFWRRILFLSFLAVIDSVLNVGVAMLLKFLLDIMKRKDQLPFKVVGMLFLIILVEVVHSIVQQHRNFYNRRTEILMEAVMSITLFQHGLCHRKDYCVAAEKHGQLNGCKDAVHSCNTEYSSCSPNPLMCPARRHKNAELPPSMYTFLYFDTCHMASLTNGIATVIRFLCSLVFGMLIIRSQIGVDILYPGIAMLALTIIMVAIEFMSGYVLKHLLTFRDARLARIGEVIGSLDVIQTSGMEDIGYNIVNDSRKDEMCFLKLRVFLMLINRAIMNSVGVILKLIVLLEFISVVKRAADKRDFDLAAPVTLLFVVAKITTSLTKLPTTLKFLIEMLASYGRLSKFIVECSPNYYLDAKDTPAGTSTALQLMNKPTSLLSNKHLVVYKNASFAWFHTIEDSLEEVSIKVPILNDLNFELERGDVKIITGNQGCGKTSFIKAMLGEMSLVSGSMAVAPLSTGMPIFYTSQEVWLPSGSIRSIITFGYAFDEDIYRQVTCAVELESDFASWEDGDMRVISEKGYSLSGGQRVRLSLARALYAYLIFSKANERLVGDRCCFLVCLDEPFNGLDPAVAGTIFNNLFNKETGLLVRDDVAVVMAMSKIYMDLFSNLNMFDNVVHMERWDIDNGSMSPSTRCNEPSNVDVPSSQHKECFTTEGGLKRASTLTRMPRNIYQVCESGEFSTMSLGYMSCVKQNSITKAADEAREQNERCSTSSGYLRYLEAVGYKTSFFIIALIVVSIVLQKANAIYIARWSDTVRDLGGCDHDGNADVDVIFMAHEYESFLVKLFSFFYLYFLFVAFLLMVVGSLRCSSRLFSFALNSIIHKNSSVITLKRSIGGIITIFSSDFIHIDEKFCKQVSSTILGLIRIILQAITMCYTIPLASPVPCILVLCIYFYVIRRYFIPAKKLECLMLDATSNINELYASTISGSPLYRSYRKEGQCIEAITTQSEYFYRSKYLKLALNVWAAVAAKMMTCCGAGIMFFIPIICHYAFGIDLRIAQIGLGISLTLGFNDSLSLVIYNVAVVERQMCSLARYTRYFCQGKCTFRDMFESMRETVLCQYGGAGHTENDRMRLADLEKRRKTEYRRLMFRKYVSLWDRQLHKCTIELLDASQYLPSNHMTLELDNVMVPEPAQEFNASTNYILKGVTASTRAGDVVGIVGRTGAGKSTLLSVLQNIASKREGSVLLDGRELNSIPRKVLRHIIGVLPQMPFVFKGWTLRRFLDPRMLHSDEEILHALECCGLLDMVKSLPGTDPLDAVLAHEDIRVQRGYYVIIPLIRLKRRLTSTRSDDGEGGVSGERPDGNVACFSMSQLRSLSFARLVLYRMTYRILLIDEPPSDNCAGHEEADQAGGSPSGAEASSDASVPIYDLVRMFFSHCTTFIVAHDKNVLRSCTSVWLMQSGTLVERCSTQEFMARGLEQIT
ncbi:ATP-BINDING CASSETTE TRANSPORTER, putative [Babesia bigemina]|uniref:ATP-BINDING CASSETTE TRANSPORTER, putative n=1 Tax=Babesia bigemina TaxID=5866 RepID=A0A061DCY4_BABBI|nr:ATP-BINDING CASSETTE TRANSPORTER, putative [Babesia bigemina]CDR96974.1 ATP-BINDING CASSETTE TRANSPORTER, putative [Babesia bigemina]|eukprot:XP_012769160.1 ATP-BINDING CASSETTE TRANSPORTER, putative [Babesia bigemina]